MNFKRGFFTLLFISVFKLSLFGSYLYKDELVFNPSFNEEIEKIGSELYKKTGISLRLVMLKALPKNMNIVDYEKDLIKDFSEPTIILTFSEIDSKVDILVNDPSLYNYFDKQQVLSPVASPVQAFVIALFYSDSISSFKEILTDYGGTIIPLLAQKSKENELIGKYSSAMFNGYADIAEQVAGTKGVTLDSAVGNANKNTLLLIKVLFYGFIVYAIFLYIKRKIYIKRQKLEQK